MNYNSDILENKFFNFFKQLMYNIALSICLILIGALVLVYGFKFGLYGVVSDSQQPHFGRGDMVIVKPKSDYEVGDILTFQEGGAVVTHRLIYIFEENGKKYYVCHGDNVVNVDSSLCLESDWKDDRAYVEKIIEEKNITTIKELNDSIANKQITTKTNIKGHVIGDLKNYGDYFNFIKDHPILLIVLVSGIWCISSVIQNEIDIKKTRRLF